MQTAALNPCLSLDALRQLDLAIRAKINATSPQTDPEGCRRLLRQRKWVRDQLAARAAAPNN